MTPTEPNSLRNLPWHSGQSVRLESENDWTVSNRWSQSLQAYW